MVHLIPSTRINAPRVCARLLRATLGRGRPRGDPALDRQDSPPQEGRPLGIPSSRTPRGRSDRRARSPVSVLATVQAAARRPRPKPLRRRRSSPPRGRRSRCRPPWLCRCTTSRWPKPRRSARTCPGTPAVTTARSIRKAVSFFESPHVARSLESAGVPSVQLSAMSEPGAPDALSVGVSARERATIETADASCPSLRGSGCGSATRTPTRS